MTHKYCNKASDVPTVKHWYILNFGQITIPGDERSRTHPGHGYPESTQSTCEYVAYDTQEEWAAEIQHKEEYARKYGGGRPNYFAGESNPAQVTTTVNVEVKT